MTDHLRSLLQSGLAEHFGHPVAIESAATLSGGCINHATRLVTSEGEFFAKWNEQGANDLFVREAESLRALAEANSGLVIPKVIAVNAEGELPGVLITSFLTEDRSNVKQQDERLGRGLAQLHRSQNDRYGFTHGNYCGATPQNNDWNDDWVDFFGQQRIGHLLKLIKSKRSLPADDQRTYDQLINRLPQLIGHQPAASLNHGDLWSGNYLYTDHGPALIDPASYYADREFDLALMAMFGGFSDTVWQSYQAAYPLPSGWQERQSLYQLYHYLNHYYLFGGGYGQQALRIAKRYL